MIVKKRIGGKDAVLRADFCFGDFNKLAMDFTESIDFKHV